MFTDFDRIAKKRVSPNSKKSASTWNNRTVTPGDRLRGSGRAIDIHRGNFEIVILFGGGKATCTTTHKGVFVRITYIDKDDKES